MAERRAGDTLVVGTGPDPAGSGTLASHTFSRRRFLQATAGLGALVLLGALPEAAEGAASPLTARMLTSAMATLPRSGSVRLPGGSVKAADLRAAAAAFAAGEGSPADPAKNPVAALGVLCALGAWSGRVGSVDLRRTLPSAPVTPLRLALPSLPSGAEITSPTGALPPGLVVRPGGALVLVGTAAGGRILVALEDPVRTIASHPRLELVLLPASVLGTLLAAAGAKVDATGSTVTLASGSKVVLRRLEAALAARLVTAAGSRFVDLVPLQPKGATPPVRTAVPVVPQPPASLHAASVNQATDGRVLALDAGGKGVGRAQYIGGTTPWRWQGADGLDYSLRDLADAAGIRFGCAPEGWLVVTDPVYTAVIDREFNFENLAGPGWQGLQAGAEAPLDLGYWHRRVDRAVGANQPMLGNLLLQNGRVDLPAWMNVDTVSRASLRRAAQDLITQEVSRLPQVAAWNVFNEPAMSALYGQGAGGSYYLQRLGDDFRPFIRDTLVWARAASAKATLIINDDYADGRDPAVTDYFVDLARWLLDQGAPLDGVGLEMHLHYDESGSASGLVLTQRMFSAALARYRALGLRVFLTELDVDMSGFGGSKAAQDAWQADMYRMVIETALRAGVRDVTVFGLTDPTSWWVGAMGRPHADALLFDGDYHPKPAYFAVRDVLRKAAGLA